MGKVEILLPCGCNLVVAQNDGHHGGSGGGGAVEQVGETHPTHVTFGRTQICYYELFHDLASLWLQTEMGQTRVALNTSVRSEIKLKLISMEKAPLKTFTQHFCTSTPLLLAPAEIKVSKI